MCKREFVGIEGVPFFCHREGGSIFCAREGDKYFLQGGGRRGEFLKFRRQKGKQREQNMFLCCFYLPVSSFKREQ